jgi:6-phosphogluconolactonase
MTFEWCEYRDREQMHSVLAGAVSAELEDFLRREPVAGLVATGGTTAPPILEQIGATDLDWGRVWVTISDERWVSPGDPASNEKMVRGNLLQGPARTAHFIPIYEAKQTPEAAESSCNERLSEMPWQSSLCMLGMGRDGHVASLFPGAQALDDALDPAFERCCKAVRPLSTEIAGPHPRMTLTLSALLRTRHIHILITGADKRAALPVTVHWAP